jgi:hypothetical protein
VALPDAFLTQNLYGVAFGLARRDQVGCDCALLVDRLDQVDAAGYEAMRLSVFAPERVAAVVVVPRD